MAVQSLAVKYRPTTFDDVSEQSAIKSILEYQLGTYTTKNAYLFCGGAGTGKTTCARIFANAINQGKGNPIELDSASNNSVDDVREIIQQAKTKSLDSEYKVFILDEVHMLSNGAWNAMLKLIEEPPAKSVFIFCTTDPQKIPKTILSRVQRYNFQRISQKGIVDRLKHILDYEGLEHFYTVDAIEYIAKIADGGMRDAITLLDKCLSYSTDLTIENVTKALGTVDYDVMFKLSKALCESDEDTVITIINEVHREGKDIKQFIKDYLTFMLDICRYKACGHFEYVILPQTYKKDMDSIKESSKQLLKMLVDLNNAIKWETNAKAVIEATLLVYCTQKV